MIIGNRAALYKDIPPRFIEYSPGLMRRIIMGDYGSIEV